MNEESNAEAVPSRTNMKQHLTTLGLSLAAGCVLLLAVGGVVLFLIRRIPTDQGAAQGTANLERDRSSVTQTKAPVPGAPPIAPPAGNIPPDAAPPIAPPAGNVPPDAAAHFNRGMALAQQGNLDGAIAAYREAIRLNPDFAEAHVNLGFLLNQQGKFDESAAENRIAIRLKPDFPTAHNNLGFALIQQGKFDEAIAAYREAIRLAPDLLAARMNLGAALRQQGKLGEAIAEYREAIQLKPDLAVAHGTLGSALFAQGKEKEAIAAYREAIRLARQTLPEDSPQRAVTLAQFGLSLLEEKQWSEAEPALRECLDIRTKIQPDLWSTFNARSMLGGALLGQKKYAEAEPLLLGGYQGMKEREKTIPPQGKVRLTEATARLIDLFTATNKPDDVKKWRAEFHEAIPLARQAFPKDSPPLAGWLAQIGHALLEQKQWAEAEPLLRECLAIREKKEPKAWTTFNAQSMLGGVLLGQKKYAEAEPLLLAGHQGMKEQEKTIPPQAKVHLREAVERLVQLYEATGKKNEAAKWRTELENLKTPAKPQTKG